MASQHRSTHDRRKGVVRPRTRNARLTPRWRDAHHGEKVRAKHAPRNPAKDASMRSSLYAPSPATRSSGVGTRSAEHPLACAPMLPVLMIAHPTRPTRPRRASAAPLLAVACSRPTRCAASTRPAAQRAAQVRTRTRLCSGSPQQSSYRRESHDQRQVVRLRRVRGRDALAATRAAG